MSQERFTLKYFEDTYWAYDNGEPIFTDDMVELLNNLYEENQSLKFQLDECRNNKLFSRRELEKENKELKQFKDKTIHILNEKIEQYKNIEPRERSINDAVFILDKLKKELEE